MTDEGKDERDGLESLVELKSAAKNVLPPSSALRELILSEPDHLPRAELAIKVKIYSKLLYSEIRRTQAK